MLNKIMERDWLIVTDEEVGEKLNETHNAFLWVVDITKEDLPLPVATFIVPFDGKSTVRIPLRRAPAGRASLRQHALCHLVRRRTARRGFFQSVHTQRNRLLRAQSR